EPNRSARFRKQPVINVRETSPARVSLRAESFHLPNVENQSLLPGRACGGQMRARVPGRVVRFDALLESPEPELHKRHGTSLTRRKPEPAHNDVLRATIVNV